MLSDAEKRELLGIARASIEETLTRRAVPTTCEGARSERLDAPGGAFVTIRVGRRLRGCIGYIESDKPLKQVVAEVAEKASTEDPRFEPLSSEELQQATLEVSILSPLQRIRCPDEVVVGKHGLLIELGRRRGLLLPQVATEYGWDRQVFLENTARKAGLPEDAWKDPKAILYTFTAEVVSEEDG